jgi:dTDP-4-amino-4,6-dideoxygalactose transaminase
MTNIPFNVPYLTGNEMTFIAEAVALGKLSGNGVFTQRCQTYFEHRYGFGKCLLTTSCTDALEMAAILANIGPGDEVIVPSFTFVSSALAFVRQGAKIVFADSESATPNIDSTRIEELITERTKAIVPVHYAGVACDMDLIMDIATRHNLLVIEDAAQAIDSYFISTDGTRRALGSIGHMAAFSFHETKNIISGEGGMLTINDERFFERSEIIWEKGTDRSKFFRGEIDKYGWVDTGSSFLPSEITAAFLWAQIEHLDVIQQRRLEIWNHYYAGLSSQAQKLQLALPTLPRYATNNAHMFYVVCNDQAHRDRLLRHLKEEGINAVFHYQSLHLSSFIQDTDSVSLPQSDRYSGCLLRLPFYHAISHLTIDEVVSEIVALEGH